MARLSALDELPAGYVLETVGRDRVVYAEALADELRAAGFRVDADPDLVQSELAGRRPLFELELDSASVLVRRYYHGGLLRWLTGERFLDPERPFRELAVAARLRAAGVRTPEVLAARARAVSGGGWRLEIVMRRVPDSVDLGFVLGRALRGELESGVRERLCASVGALVHRLHTLSCIHADLTPNNMLVDRATLDSEQPALWILDLDGAQVLSGPLTDDERRTNLRRLMRFIDRRERDACAPLRRRELVRFFEQYDPDGRRWRSDWQAIRADHMRTRGAHSAAWALERWFARSPDPRFGGGRGHQRGS